MTAALEGGEWSVARPGRTLPPGKTRYPLYRRLGGPHGPVCTNGKISSPPGFDSGPSSPVAQSLYRLSYPIHDRGKRVYKTHNRRYTQFCYYAVALTRIGCTATEEQVNAVCVTRNFTYVCWFRANSAPSVHTSC